MSKEVYIAYGLNNEVLYVGQGNIGRHKHCLSGTSHNKDLNRYYFQNGEDGSIKVNVLHTNINQDDAITIETELISSLNPICNISGTVKDYSNLINQPNGDLECLLLGYKVDYKRVMNIYLKAIDNGDFETVSIIDDKSPEHKYHYETIGAETIKALGVNKTKIKKAVAVAENFNSTFFTVISHLNLKVGNKYNLAQLKKEIQKVYDKVGLEKTTKATDVKLYYNVRDCYLNRKDAYEILGHKTEFISVND